MKIVLNNGVEYGATWCGTSDGVLYAELVDAGTIPELAQVFDDAEATETIKSVSGNHTEEYRGFTNFLGVRKDRYNGYITITLQKMTDYREV